MSVAIHMGLTRIRHHSILACFASGLFFGIVALNTKITALALLPFHFCWIFVQRAVAYIKALKFKEVAELREKIYFSDSVFHCAVFFLGSVIAYSPWFYIYWVLILLSFDLC
jgi:hypothetical protein